MSPSPYPNIRTPPPKTRLGFNKLSKPDSTPSQLPISKKKTRYAPTLYSVVFQVKATRGKVSTFSTGLGNRPLMR